MNHLARRPVGITPGGCGEANYAGTRAGTEVTNPEMLELFIQRSQQLVPSVRRKGAFSHVERLQPTLLCSQSQTGG